MIKIKKKMGLVLMSSVVSLGLLAACGSEESSGSSEGGGSSDGKMKIEVVAKGFQHDFWRAVKTGAEQAAEEAGAELQFVGPKNESAIAEQVEMINNAINKKPSAIALAALDTSASLDAISKAMDNGIPIIGFDSGVPDAPEGSVLANAATDNYAAGELAAEGMFKGIEEKVASANGEVVRIGVVAQEVNSMSITARTQGFIDKMVELTEGVESIGAGKVAVTGHTKLENDVKVDDALVVIETRVPAQLTDAAGQTEAQTLLEKSDLIGIYGSNEFAAKAIINADNAISDGRIGPDKVIAVGFDSGALQLDAVKTERFYGSVTQDPIAIGYNAVKLAVAAANGEEVADVDTGAKWYDASNIESEEIAPLLYE